MPPRTCTVTFTDVRGARHTVEVAAESLYEAAALAISRLKDEEWLENQPGPASRLEVEIREPAIKHTVTVQQVRNWSESPASPSEMVKKKRVRAMLALKDGQTPQPGR